MNTIRLIIDAGMILSVAVIFTMVVMIGIDRDVSRQAAITEANCTNYGPSMNNWARQNNLTPPCAE